MRVRRFWLLGVLWVGFIGGYASGDETENVTPLEVIQKYKEALSCLKSVSMKIDMKIKAEIDGEKIPGTSAREFTFRQDHNRAEWLGKLLHIDDRGDVDLEKSHIIKTIMDGDSYANLIGLLKRPALGATISSDKEFYNNELNKRLSHPIEGGPLWGRMWGSNYKNVADLLSESTNVHLRENWENINGTSCYVVEAATRYGKVTAWIAPEKGYNALKWTIQKKPGDLFNEKPISLDSWLATFVANNLRKVGDFWVTKAGCLTFRIDYSDESPRETKTTIYKYNTSDIQINPDFKALGAFKIDFPDGTPVQIVEVPGIRYVWQNGKPVAFVDKSFLDVLDNEIEQIKSEVKAEPTTATEKKIEVPPDEPSATFDLEPEARTDSREAQREVLSESRAFHVLPVILIGLLIIVVIGWLVFRQRRRSNDAKT